MFKHRLIAAGVALAAFPWLISGSSPTDHDAPVQLGGGSFWLSLDESITQTSAPADKTSLFQHTHHSGVGAHRIRVFHIGDLNGGSGTSFDRGDELRIFFSGDGSNSPSVTIQAVTNVMEPNPLHNGHYELICGGVPGGASEVSFSLCRPDPERIRPFMALLGLTPADLNPASLLEFASRLRHAWRFEARNNGKFVRTKDRTGRVGYYYENQAGSRAVTAVRMVLRKPVVGTGTTGTTETTETTVADRLNKLKCWMAEISYPDKTTHADLSPTREELARANACQRSWLFPCKICPAEFFKPGQEKWTPPPAGQGH